MTVNLLAIALTAIIHLSSANSSIPSPEIQSDPKIIGGSAISIDQAPWQVSIRLRKYEKDVFGLGHICGGSVISQRVIVTAAHCGLNLDKEPIVKRPAKDFIIVMGSGYLFQKTENTLIYDVLQVITHDGFTFATMMHDVALMFIDGQIPSNHRTIRPTYLNALALPDGTVCTVSGWGKMSNDRISNVLMAASVPIINSSSCEKSYGKLGSGMFCAGYLSGKADSCQGDSGGGLQCGLVLGGLVSWGFECGKANYPGVYTNVSEYRNWIISKNRTLNYTRYGSGAKLFQEQHKLVAISVILLLFRLI